MADDKLKGQLNRGLAWVGLASSAVALLDVLALVLILKFWVSADEYGIASVVVTLFAALELAAEAGLSAAVIQRDDHSPEKLSTIFWLNILFGLAFYGLIVLAAPLMGKLHGHAVITTMFQVYGINLVLRAAYSTHQALMKKELRFKELSVIRIFANLADFVVKVAMAMAGLGVWCFVWGILARSLVFAVGVPLRHGWRPRLVCRPRETLGYVTFGLRTSGGEILFQLYSNIDYQIVNLFFGAHALGVYRAAYELVLEPVRFISGVVVGVAFPAFARLQHDMAAVIDQLITFTRQNLLVVLSLVGLILVAADDMLVVILKPEYAAAATAARILAIVGVFRALSYLGPPLLGGLGRPELALRYQVVAAIVLTALFAGFAYVLGDRLGFMSVALAWAVGYPVAFFVLYALMMDITGLSPFVYMRKLIGIPACVAGACAAGLLVRRVAGELVPGVSPLVRLLVIAAVMAVVLAVLLARFQGISPRTILGAMKKSA